MWTLPCTPWNLLCCLKPPGMFWHELGHSDLKPSQRFCWCYSHLTWAFLPLFKHRFQLLFALSVLPTGFLSPSKQNILLSLCPLLAKKKNKICNSKCRAEELIAWGKGQASGKAWSIPGSEKRYFSMKNNLPDYPSQEEEKYRQAIQIGPLCLVRDLKASSQSESPTVLAALYLPPVSQQNVLM